MAASVGRRHGRLVVVHKGPVDPQLTGLGERESERAIALSLSREPNVVM